VSPLFDTGPFPLNDAIRNLRNRVLWAVLTISGSLGVILLIKYTDRPKQLVIAGIGIASGVMAITALRTTAKRSAIRRTWWAVALFTLTIIVMVLVHNLWPPLFPPACDQAC